MSLFKKISTSEKKDFVGALMLLIKSGIPINEAFDLLSKQTRSPALKKVFEKAKERTEKGTPIYQVFEDDPNFEIAFSSFIRAGEESGTLDQSLKFLVGWLERKHNLEREISSATLYPKIVLIFAILLSGGLAFFVLPKLTLIFEALNTNLPLTSRILLYSSNFVQKHGLVLLLGIAVVVAFFYALSRIKAVRILFDKIVLRMPIVGEFVRLHQLTIISQLISVLFGSGLVITKILDVAAESTSNYSYKKSLEHIKKRIIRGDTFSSAINDFPNLYPDIYLNILTTGEATGSFTESFAYLADFFSTKLSEKNKQLPVILEPVILIVIGAFVAFIASAIILPIYQVTQGFY
ncbi:MAG: type II secretion system F family protein [Candidatus Paceibacterota bacterium]